MGKHWPNLPGCGPCGDPPQQTFRVPTCPEETDQLPDAPCQSTDGKFYDLTTKKFVVPKSGTTGELSVCDPTRFSGCQWLAICYQQNRMAIFRVVDVNVGRKTITVFNGCANDDEISDNPEGGTSIPQESVVYAVPPPWCSLELCKKIQDILASADPNCGACQGVRTCLENSEEVCFSNVPEVEEGEETFLLAASKDLVSEDNPTFWKACLRKLKNILFGPGGTTICMPEIPETDDTDEVVDGDDTPKRFIYWSPTAGCLKKGRAVSDGQCGDDVDVTPVVDDLGEAQSQFDKIHVCVNGERKNVPGIDWARVIQSYKFNDGTVIWVSRVGYIFRPHSALPIIWSTSNGAATVIVNLPNFPPLSLGADCWVHCSIETEVGGGGFNLVADGQSIGGIGPGTSAIVLNNVMFKVTGNTFSLNYGVTSRNVFLRLLGYSF